MLLLKTVLQQSDHPARGLTNSEPLAYGISGSAPEEKYHGTNLAVGELLAFYGHPPVYPY